MASTGQKVLDQLRKYKTQIQLARANSLLSSEGRLRLEDEIRRSMDAYRVVAAKELSVEWTEIRKAYGRIERQLANAEQNAREGWDYRRLHAESCAVVSRVAQASGVAEIEAAYACVEKLGDRVTLRAWQESAPSALLTRWPEDRDARRLSKRIACALVHTLSEPEVEAVRRSQTTLVRRAVEAYVATEVARAEFYPGATPGTDEFSNLLSGVELSRLGDVEVLGLGRTLTVARMDPVKVSLN